jgi:hypothetical protein
MFLDPELRPCTPYDARSTLAFSKLFTIALLIVVPHVHKQGRCSCRHAQKMLNLLGLALRVPIISPYTLGSIWSSGLSRPLRRPYTPLATSAHAALAPHQTTDQVESAHTTLMVM